MIGYKYFTYIFQLTAEDDVTVRRHGILVFKYYIRFI
jgi:hypothetical protein